MNDYAAYKKDKQITNQQFLKTIHEEYEGFTKAQNSFISYPERYALCLTDEAEEVLVKKYGIGPGLAHYKLKSKKRKDSRRKKNRMVVRLNDDMYVRVLALMHSMNFSTVQEFLETTLTVMVEREEGIA